MSCALDDAQPPRPRTSIDRVAGVREQAIEQERHAVELDAFDAEALRATGRSTGERDLRGLHAELLGEQRDECLVGSAVLRGRGDLDLQRVAVPADDRGAARAGLGMDPQHDRIVAGCVVQGGGHEVRTVRTPAVTGPGIGEGSPYD